MTGLPAILQPDEKSGKLVITNSLLRKFRACPRALIWRYREELEPVRTRVSLSYGQLGHRLLALIYRNHSENRESLDKLLIAESLVWVKEQVAQAEKIANERPHQYQDDPGLDEIESDAIVLSREVVHVVRHYIDSGPFRRDIEDYNVLFVEKRFAVRFLASDGRPNPRYSWSGVWDLVLENKKTGAVFVLDHKFTSREPDELLASLDVDTQPRGYLYGARLLANLGANKRQQEWESPIWPVGREGPRMFLYNILRRGIPKKPRLLAKRKKPTLSRDLTVPTTPELYLEALAEHGIDPDPYLSHIEKLRASPYISHKRGMPNISKDEIAAWAEESLGQAHLAFSFLRHPERAWHNTEECRRLTYRCSYIPLCFGDYEIARHRFVKKQAHSELVQAENDEKPKPIQERAPF